MSEYLDMDSDVSSCCSVVVGGFEPSSPTLSSNLGSTHGPIDDTIQYCQCIDSEDVVLFGVLRLWFIL
jgi:hypothetical protein